MNIGEQINNLRKKNGLSQDDFAELFHVSRQTVSNWENGKSYPDLEMMIKISDYFKVSIDELLKQDSNTVVKIDSQKKKSKVYLGMLIAVLTISISIIIGIFFYYKNSNSVSFTMKKGETYQINKAEQPELTVATGHFSVQKSGKLKLQLEAHTDDGKLHILISDKDGEAYYQLDGQDVKDSQELYFEKNSYMVQIVADGYEEEVVSINYAIDIHN